MEPVALKRGFARIGACELRSPEPFRAIARYGQSHQTYTA